MKSTEIHVERFNAVSTKSFEETLAGLYAGIGRPEMSSLAPRLAAAESFSEFEQLVNGAVGTADLMEFLRLGYGLAEGPRSNSLQDDTHHRRQSTDHEPNGGACSRRWLLRSGHHSHLRESGRDTSRLRHNGKLSVSLWKRESIGDS
jgi:hypothetical protein